MASNLVIVESPAKAKTINKYLGSDFIVKATMGHIKNLPENRLGVDIEKEFEPEYVTIPKQKKILAELRALGKKVKNIYIATDPDREGEAIAWHICNELNNNNSVNIYRVLFNEITATKIKQEIAKPGKIKSIVVESQKARRVVDRIVGYKISPFLWKTISKGLSAGRVQSVALRLICEREDEFEAFKQEEFWKVTAELKSKTSETFSSLAVKKNNKTLKISSGDEADAVIKETKDNYFTIAAINKKEVSRKPYPPFITSTLQQEASRRLGITTKKIMEIAQRLYEGIDLGDEGSVGLITYMRTDSVRVSKEAQEWARSYIASSYGVDYVPEKAPVYRRKKKAQDAHEAIRPTYLKYPPEAVRKYLKTEEYKLYWLIWNRFISSQMKNAKIAQTSIDISCGAYLFRTSGSQILFRGFLQAFDDFKDDNEIQKDPVLPVDLKKGEVLELKEIIPTQHFTKPPARFNESSLVKELDAKDIGRPSTYATIISTILSRKYVGKKNKALVPSELGRAVNKLLVSNFNEIFNVKFTAEMESELDKIEAGKKKSIQVVKDFYTPFDKSLSIANSRRSEIKKNLVEETDIKCDRCGKPMVIKIGRNGKFMACSGFPGCRNTKPIVDENAENKADKYNFNDKCDKCGAEMVLKRGRYGPFLACPGYPDCSNTHPLEGMACPENQGSPCSGTLVKKRGKGGAFFYGCSNYPECQFTLS